MSMTEAEKKIYWQGYKKAKDEHSAQLLKSLYAKRTICAICKEIQEEIINE